MKTVTTDLSSSMMLVVRNVFPCAMLVNDWFHVQQLFSEAIDQLRIRFRWEMLDAENQQIKKHREVRKEAKEKGESVEDWKPSIQENGETMPQIMARSRHLILKNYSKWKEFARVLETFKTTIRPSSTTSAEDSQTLLLNHLMLRSKPSEVRSAM